LNRTFCHADVPWRRRIGWQEPRNSPSRMELRCGWHIHQKPNDGLILGHQIPDMK